MSVHLITKLNMLFTKITGIKNYLLAHKVITVIGAVVLIYGGYWEHARLTSTAGETRYVVAAAEKGTLVASITGSGSVSAVSSVDIKTKASGDVIYVGAKNGDEVKAGALLLQLDAADAVKAVRDAQVSLDSAKLSLEKIKKPTDALTLTQSQNTLDRAVNTKQNAEDDLAKSYDDGFNSISNAFLDLPSIVSGLHDLLYTTSSQLGGTNVNNIDYYASTANNFDSRGASFGADAATKYKIALDKYNKSFQDYKALDRSADKSAIEAMITETYDTTLAISEAVKSSNNLIQFFEDQMVQHNQHVPVLADTQLTTLNGFIGKSNTHLTDLISIGATIKKDKSTIADAVRTIDENTQSLAKLKAGTDPLDIEGSELTVKQRQNAVLDAQEKLSQYYVRAPFAGTVAKVSLKKGDSASSGAVAATLVTKQKLATIALNEVDVARIHKGQKATLTFDAVEGLAITGEVSDVDTVGTVTQGVVNYTVTIIFDTQDERVKPSMSVSAAIVTDVKTDVVLVPNSAIKTQGTNHYVEKFVVEPVGSDTAAGGISAVAPAQVPVVTGLSNDTSTEVVSGLSEGEKVVTRTITAASTAAKTTTPSLFGGGGARIGR